MPPSTAISLFHIAVPAEPCCSPWASVVPLCRLSYLTSQQLHAINSLFQRERGLIPSSSISSNRCSLCPFPQPLAIWAALFLTLTPSHLWTDRFSYISGYLPSDPRQDSGSVRQRRAPGQGQSVEPLSDACSARTLILAFLYPN